MAKSRKYEVTKTINSDRRARLASVHRVVIKLGTNIVTGGTREFCSAQVAPLLRSIARLKREGRQVVLISSGAIGIGAGKLGVHRARLHDLATRQACAAVGQSVLMHAYEQLFARKEIAIAQVLLTEYDFTERKRHLNLRRTMEKLLKLGVLPIINENDSVSSAELNLHNTDLSVRSFGDNDRLAALVMSKLDADALIILTNVDGLLRSLKSQRTNGSRRAESLEVVPVVTELTSEIKALARGHSFYGRGGMTTKLAAAEIAMQTGGIAVIANGTKPDILGQIFRGDVIGTLFVSHTRLNGKRRWISYAASVRGRVIVNAGARDAILGSKASLLASGVVRVEGPFDSNDVVSIVDNDGREFARGIANYASYEVEKFSGEVACSCKGRNSKVSVLVRRNNILLREK